MPNGFIKLSLYSWVDSCLILWMSSGWCPYVRISDDIITDEWVGEWVTTNGIVSCVFAFCEIITIITTSSDIILLSLCPSRWSWMAYHVRTRDGWECFHSLEVHLWIHLQIIVKAIILRILYYLGQWSPISITCFYPSPSLSRWMRGRRQNILWQLKLLNQITIPFNPGSTSCELNFTKVSRSSNIQRPSIVSSSLSSTSCKCPSK